MNTASLDQTSDLSSEDSKPCVNEQSQSVPNGFEDFDLDDIEVIESKVFA